MWCRETRRLNASTPNDGLGAKALQDMQTDFAQQVGQQHGLERGLEGSKSRHTTIQAYYGRVERGVSKRRAWTFLSRLWGIV